MPDGYNLPETRFVQWRTVTSGADALSLVVGPVPDGKIWTITAAGYWPDVDETRIVQFAIYRTGNIVPITEPTSFPYLAAGGMMWAAVREGLELRILPGESLMVARDDHTAGSTMNLRVRYIESDMPLYTYDEPQIVKRQARALSTVRSMIGGAGGRGPGPMVGPRGGGGRPGGGGPQPI